jgi:hypothetical protein
MKARLMPFSRTEFSQMLVEDEKNSFNWEHLSSAETMSRKVKKPATTLGNGRGRFWEILSALSVHLEHQESLIDFGAYPGTLLRLLRTMRGGAGLHLGAAGFGYSPEFLGAMQQLRVSVLEMEFDVRYPMHSNLKHILFYPAEQGQLSLYDVGVCTEVLEHQMYPLSLLAGINRFIKTRGSLYLTTNSVSFIGDILKLVLGRHNVEEIRHSHVLNDSLWRPHIRLFTLAEVKLLVQMAGFEIKDSYYFDNGGHGGIYSGMEGMVNSSVRLAASAIPHLRSHIFVAATKVSPPSDEALSILRRVIDMYNLGAGIRV